MSKLSILTRLSILSVVLLLLLVASNLFLDNRLMRNANTLAKEAELVRQITTANRASKTFGDLKFWLADLAVSLLTLSEKNAEAALTSFNAILDHLELHEPADVAAIRQELDTLMTAARLAVDAYTEDRRVIGNSRMASARVHIQKIDDLLSGIVDRLQARSERQAAPPWPPPAPPLFCRMRLSRPGRWSVFC